VTENRLILDLCQTDNLDLCQTDIRLMSLNEKLSMNTEVEEFVL